MTQDASDTDDRLFLSYARDDDPDFVAGLYERLRGAGFDVWWDMVNMPSRGLTFLDEIRRVIQAAGRLLVVVGPEAIASEYVRAEWQCALAEGKVVVPLLRASTFESLPAELSPLNCLDQRPERDAEIAFGELLEKLRAPLPATGKLHGAVPDLPTRYQPRPADFNALAALVLADLEAPVQIEHGERAVVVQGMGGVGKSVVAAAFARSTSTRRAFDHGVFWVRAGVGPLAALRRLAGLLRLPGAATADPGLLASQVRDALAARPRALIVLDDAPDVEPLEPLLDVLAVRTRVLVTTRDAELAAAAGARAVQLRELAPAAARQLLADWAGVDPAALPPAAHAVAERCGGLPLALALNGAVAASSPWSDVLEALEEADLEFAERRIAHYQHRTVAAALRVSLAALARWDPRGPDRYRELVIFRSAGGIPEPAVTRLWTATGGLKPREGRRLVTTLARAALVRLDGEAPTRRLVLHDLLDLQLRAMDIDERPLHAALVDAYRGPSPGGWTTARPDGYLHDHLVEHLLAADRPAEAYALCLDPAWFAAVERADPAGGAESFLASLDPVLDSARRAGDLRTAAQASVVAARFSESAPPEVVAVFADAAHTRRAERIAATIEFALDRCRAFSLLAERAVSEEARQSHVREAQRCVESIDHAQRGMAFYWICRALSRAGAGEAARRAAAAAWASVEELAGGDPWNVPNAQLWAAKAYRLLGDDGGLARVRRSLEVVGRNLDLQTAGICGDVQALRSFPLDQLYPLSMPRRGNLALACAEAGLDRRRDQLLAKPEEGEPDAARRFAWALALAGRFAAALEVVGGVAHPVEQAKALRRVMHVAACRDRASAITAAADLAERLAEGADAAASDAWRVRAHLARALSRAGRHRAACALAERICREGLAATEENSLLLPERLRVSRAREELAPAGELLFKTGPRPLDTSVEPLPDEASAARVAELARAGELEAARDLLPSIRLPRPRVGALLALARHEPAAETGRQRWVDALLTARSVGRRLVDEVLAAAAPDLAGDLAEAIRELDARWR